MGQEYIQEKDACAGEPAFRLCRNRWIKAWLEGEQKEASLGL